MKNIQVERSESKANMGKKEIVATIKDYPETGKELITQVNDMTPEQVQTLLHLLMIETKVFIRQRKDSTTGRMLTLGEVYTLPRKTNIGKAIADITDKVEQLVLASGQLMAAGDIEGAKANMQEMQSLLAKKKQLEDRQSAAKAKKAASRAANKAKADSKPNPKK